MAAKAARYSSRYPGSTVYIVIDLENYKDSKVKAGTDKETLKELIINTYTTILARGIKGCYVYAYNKNMQKYLKKFIIPANEVTLEEK